MRLHLKNFQSISDATLELGAITVITGPSDLGKSALIRSLNLLHRNSGGLDLVKYGKANLFVEQELDNGTKVSITKGKAVNAYSINGRSYSKIGRDVPEEVATALNTSPLSLDKDQSLDLNFSFQFDSPFLLSDSSSVVTKAISSLSGINIIYSAIREGNAEASKLKAKAEVLGETVVKLTKYDLLSSESEALALQYNELVALNDKIALAEVSLQAKQVILKQWFDLASKEIDTDYLYVGIFEMELVCKSMLEHEQNLSSLKQIVSKYSGISEYSMTESFEADYKSLEEKAGALATIWNIVEDKSKRLKDLKELHEGSDLIALKSLQFPVVMKGYEDDLERLKPLVSICETCGRPT
jgi:DNA repair ATPase RecN